MIVLQFSLELFGIYLSPGIEEAGLISPGEIKDLLPKPNGAQ